jgi:hypothetical protein
MKHKKTVTDSVLAANRANAKFSTGPRTEQGKSNSGHNTFRHGVLAKRVVLETHEERSEFKRLFQQCQDDFGPEGLLERVLMEEITIILWKLRIVIRLETRELSLLQEGPDDQISDVFDGDLKLPIGGRDLPINKGWDCERIVVRAVAGHDKNTSSASRGPTVYAGKVLDMLHQSSNQNSQDERHLEVEAVLGSSLDRITRYQSALKRDLYRAMGMLRSIQSERREHEEG